MVVLDLREEVGDDVEHVERGDWYQSLCDMDKKMRAPSMK